MNGVKFGVPDHFDHMNSVDFFHGALLIETGHILGFWALSGECVGVNVEGEQRHICDTLRRVLASYTFKYKKYSS